MELRSKLCAGVFVATATITAVFIRLGSYLIHYGVGRGTLGFGWAFLAGLPLIAAAFALGSALALCVLVALGANVPGRLWAVFLGSLAVLSILVGPSAKTGDRHICEGLARRITSGASDRRLDEYLQELLAAHPEKTTNSTLDVTAQIPRWLREVFPERHVAVHLYNVEIRYVRVEVGGPFLSYGCAVGMTAPEIPPLRGDPATLGVASNIVVFAQ